MMLPSLQKEVVDSNGRVMRAFRCTVDDVWKGWYIDGSKEDGYTLSSVCPMNLDFPRLGSWIMEDLFGVAVSRERRGDTYEEPKTWKYFPFVTRSYYKQQRFSFWCEQQEKQKRGKHQHVLIQLSGANFWLTVYLHDSKRFWFNPQPLSIFGLERVSKPSKPPVFAKESMEHTIPRNGVMT